MAGKDHVTFIIIMQLIVQSVLIRINTFCIINLGVIVKALFYRKSLSPFTTN